MFEQMPTPPSLQTQSGDALRERMVAYSCMKVYHNIT